MTDHQHLDAPDVARLCGDSVPEPSTESPGSLSITARPKLRRTGSLGEAPPPEIVVDVRTLGGAEGRRLARQQARVLWEVTEWLAQNEHSSGQRRAA